MNMNNYAIVRRKVTHPTMGFLCRWLCERYVDGKIVEYKRANTSMAAKRILKNWGYNKRIEWSRIHDGGSEQAWS
jgi:hypothetical protein